MRHAPVAIILAVLIIWCAVSPAQEPRNIALGKPYMLSPGPSDAYADDQGPEPHQAGGWFRGELTDGVRGPGTSFRAAEFVGWRQTGQVDPIAVTIDLEEAVTIGEVRTTAFGGPHGAVPPPGVTVWVQSPDFPTDAFVRIGRMTPDKLPDLSRNDLYHYALPELAVRATMVRLDYEQPAWQYLFVDEIEVLAAAGEARMLAVEDVTIEAEAFGDGTAVEGASGTAVLLTDEGASLDVTVPLPAGEYTILLRSMAVEPDTFSEIIPSAGDRQMRPQPVTNSVFTRQRSHFSHHADGEAALSITLAEGAGVWIDQVRIQRLALGYTITEPYQFQQDTVLVAGGNAQCLIVIGDHGEYREQAEAVAAAIEAGGAVRPEIRLGTEVTEEEISSLHLVCLGDRFSNFALLAVAPEAWHTIPSPPADGAPQVWVEVEPRGTRTNCIVIGGKDAAQVQASLGEFLRRLEGDEEPVYRYEIIPAPELTLSREQYKQLAVETGQWIRQGAIRTLHNRWKVHGAEGFVLLGYRYIEYKDSADTITQVANDGFVDAETMKIVGYYDYIEHYGYFSEAERVELTNIILVMALMCERVFDWDCVRLPGKPKQHDPRENRTDILKQVGAVVAHNHQTFPVRSLVVAGRYFDYYYDLPDAKLWLEWSDLFMEGPLLTSKPLCDCTGYQEITMVHAARHAATTGRWEYFKQEPLYQYLRLSFMSYDNMGSIASYGDVGGYHRPAPSGAMAATIANFVSATGGRIDGTRINPQAMLGVYIHPLEPMWYATYESEMAVPLEQTFDKISFRESYDPDRAYLLLDGLSRGYHGHWDGNSILRFTDNGRMWLCEADYLKGDPKDHITVTPIRNGESARPTMVSALEGSVVSPTWGTTITRTPGYAGLDWDRHIIWHRPSDTFILLDDTTATEAGTYDIKARFRSLGEASLAGRSWHVEQAGNEHFHLHLPGRGRLMEGSAPDEAKNWTSYEFADDPTPKLLSHQAVKELAPGERATLRACFYADSTAQPRLEVRALGEHAIATDGPLQVVAGVGGLEPSGLGTDARHFVFGPEDLLLVQATRLHAGFVAVSSDKPIDLALDARTGEGLLKVGEPTTVSVIGIGTVTFEGQEGQPGTQDIPAGTYTFRADVDALAAALAAAYQAAWAASTAEVEDEPAQPTANMTPVAQLQLPAALRCLATGDVTGDGTDECAAGCIDGTLIVADATGRELWRIGHQAAVNDVVVADLDGDGRAEVICGVEDEHIYVYGPDGTLMWKRYFEAFRSEGGREGWVRVVHVADFDGDGSPEVVAGCANTFVYVMDAQGNTKQSHGRDWVFGYRHSVSALGSADVSGDGQLELLAGWTYPARWIIDFADTGRSHANSFGGSIGGCFAIAAGDVDGDGLPEGLFGDSDGQLTAASKSATNERTADIRWQKIIGDDMIVKLLADDYDGNGALDIIVASRSGFLARLDAAGTSRWVRYAHNALTDAARVPGDTALFARSSADGSVAVYDIAGDEQARWHIGTPVQGVAAGRGVRPAIFAAAADRLMIGLLGEQ